MVSSTIRAYDQKVTQAKISEYALVERTNRLPALIRNIHLEQENNLESDLLIRLADSHNRTLTETIPSRWKAAHLKKIENSSVPMSEEQSAIPGFKRTRGRARNFQPPSLRRFDPADRQEASRSRENSWRVSDPFSQAS